MIDDNSSRPHHRRIRFWGGAGIQADLKTVSAPPHGTGCIFASALAANLARKKTVRESVTAAKDFITAAIRDSLAIGKGYGPANPMAMLHLMPAIASLS